MKTKKSNLTVKLIITAILGALGISYIMYKPPVSQVSSYQKQSMPKPYRYKKDSSSKSSSSSSVSEADSDAISLTGKKGSYDSHRIGKQ